MKNAKVNADSPFSRWCKSEKVATYCRNAFVATAVVAVMAIGVVTVVVVALSFAGK